MSPVQDLPHHILQEVHHRHPPLNHNLYVVDSLEAILLSVYLIHQTFDQPVALLGSTPKVDLKFREKKPLRTILTTLIIFTNMQL